MFTVPVSLELGKPICRQGDESIVAAAMRPIVSPDSEMRRVGTCTEPDLNLYARADQPALLYVKTEFYRYLAVHPQAGGPNLDRAVSTSGSTSDR